jgi:CDP-diacylglycerol--serine O-phosphatidyltransferase
MKRQRLRTRGGVFLLPAVFTVANIFLGFFSIIQSFRGEFGSAGLIIGFAILADVVDGRVARFAGATSEFGRELDSLADVVSFGVAPAVLAYAWVLHRWPQTGWLVAALFTICAAVRLARFNVGRLNTDPRYYTGMSSPAAAAVIGAVVYWHPASPENSLAAAACLFGTLGLALLMNSPVRYPSFKSQTGRRPQSHRTLVVLAVFIVATIAEPVAMFLVLAGGYAAAPLLGGLRRLGRHAGRPVSSVSGGADEAVEGAPIAGARRESESAGP